MVSLFLYIKTSEIYVQSLVEFHIFKVNVIISYFSINFVFMHTKASYCQYSCTKRCDIFVIKIFTIYW
jgi:hypothetical protein